MDDPLAREVSSDTHRWVRDLYDVLELAPSGSMISVSNGYDPIAFFKRDGEWWRMDLQARSFKRTPLNEVASYAQWHWVLL